MSAITPAAHDRLRIALPLLLLSAGAWTVLLMQSFGMAIPAFCGGHGLVGDWSSLSARLGLLMLLNPPAGIAVGWGLMLVAMMAPVLIHPLQHLHDRSFRDRRLRSVLLFLAGYLLPWLVAGLLIMAFAGMLFVLSATLAGTAAFALALLWQASPGKQFCLNRCHSVPDLAAFGVAADRDAIRFGLDHARWCVGSCWGLMLVPLLVERGHIGLMAAGAGWAVAERYDRPAPLAWRWRWPRKAFRISYGQCRAIFRASRKGK